MTNKSATNLRDVGIIATIVLVSVILLKFSSKDDSIKVAPAGASAAVAAANQSVVNPSSQIAGDFKEESANLTDTFQALPESSSESIANVLEPSWTVSRAIDDTVVMDVPPEIEATSSTFNSGTSRGGSSSGGGTGDSSSGDSSGGGATGERLTGGDGTSGDSTSSGSGSTDAVSSGQDSAGVTTTTGGGSGSGGDGQRAQDFQKIVEKHFTAGDRLLMPLGVFAVTNYIRNTDEMKRLVENGITFIQRYDGNLTIARAYEDIDNAAKAGMPLVLSLSYPHLKYDQRWWTNYLQALVDQKQIIIWYLPEEPEMEDLPRLREVTELLHKLDKSRRLVTTYLKGTDRKLLTEASEFMDCVIVGAYPSGSPGVPRVRIAYHIDLAYSCQPPAVIAALESYETINGWTKPEHLEFDAYLSLIHGAKGIMWYCYAQVRNNPELIEAMLTLARTLNGPEHLGEVFIQGEENKDIQLQILAGPRVFLDGFTNEMKLRMWNNPSVHWRAYNHRGNVYLVMVNCCQVLKQAPSQAEEKALTIEVEFQGFNADSKVALLDGESRYNWDSGKLKVKLEPLGAAVFKFSPVDK